MTAAQAIEQLTRPNGGIDPQIRAAATEVVLAAAAAGHEVKGISWFNPASTPEHHVPGMAGQKGVAVDFMCDRATGDFIGEYMWTHRERLGLCWEIWRDRIRSTSPGKPGTWQARGKGDHYDHVHGNFGHLVGTNGSRQVDKITYKPLGAAQRPSAGTVWLDRLVPGVTDSDSIRAVQRALGVPPTGTLDAATLEASKAKQRSWGDINVDGLFGPKQTALLFKEAGLDVTIRTDPSGQAPATPKPTPKPTTPEVPAVTHSLTVKFGNPLWNNDSRGGGWGKRKAGAVKALLAKNPDVIMVCEIDPQQAEDIYTLLPGQWGYWRVVGGTRYGPLAIYWRQSVMERRADAIEHEYSDNDSRYLLSLPLVHKASGETVWFDVTHLENDGDTATNGKARRKLQATELAARTKTGKRIGGGDLNSTSLASSSNGDKPRVIMGRAGLHLLTSQPVARVENRAYASHHSTLTARPKGPWIDDMWWRGVDFVKGGLTLTDYSDHGFPWVTVNL